MSFRKVLNTLMVPCVPLTSTVEVTEKPQVNHERSLGSLSSPSKIGMQGSSISEDNIGINLKSGLNQPTCVCGYRPPFCACGFYKFPG